MDEVALDRKFEKVNEVIERHKRKVSSLVAILQDVQAEYRYLPQEVMTYVATALSVPPSVVYGVATFYSQFSMEPKGKYVIKVCDGTACHVRGSEPVHYAIRKAAGLKSGQITTDDLTFTVETVACVGACGLAPVVMVNDEQVYGQMTPEEARKLISGLKQTDEPVVPRESVAIAAPDLTGMRRLPNRRALDELQKSAREAIDSHKARVLLCMETACMANGAQKVYDALVRAVTERGLGAEVSVLASEGGCECGRVALVRAGCHGYCELGPLVKIMPHGILYTKVTPADADEIVRETLAKGEVIERLLYQDPATGKRCLGEEGNPFYAGQRKVALALCGLIDSEDIREYIAFGGYQALAKAIFQMSPEKVIEEVNKAGLRGRGGGGFPTGRKWEFARQAASDIKYVVCNGDEGDPGAFMDRSVMEGDPHTLLEGMMIAGYAIGASEGYIYVRAEYPLAVRRLRKAIDEATALGLLGDNILGSGFRFTIGIKEGAGAFVCGEETALLASMMGGRGMPRPRPPFPASSGLNGKPTIINNVETLANVPLLIARGADWFRSVGTEKSPGTKTFALAGQVQRTGLIEVPMGITLREVVFGIGGGLRRPERQFKAVQIGGPSGGCLTRDHLDMPLDFDSLSKVGAMIGSGGLVVIDDGTCMVEVARFFMTFVQNESCGKCVPCREGTKQMLRILNKITDGEGTEQDIEDLYQLAETVKSSSLCGLGKTAPNPVLTTLAYFKDEYMAHVRDKRCPAGVCQKLRVYVINVDKCKGCGLCKKVCPVSAISGELRGVHTINLDLCTRCGSCVERCKFNAIDVS